MSRPLTLAAHMNMMSGLREPAAADGRKALRSDLFVIDTDGCCWVHGSKASQYSHFEDMIDSYSVCGNNLPASDSAGGCDRDTNDFMTAFFGGPMGGTPFIYPLMYDMQAGGACNLTHSNPGSCTPPKPIIRCDYFLLHCV